MLNVATDCSGVGAPEQALKELGIEYRSVFACEKDKYARMTFLANHHTETMYEDIKARDNTGIEPVDLYIAGYPCQAFSNSGKKKGESDARGTIFYSGYEFIKANRPKVFILENVPGMLNVNGVNILEKWLDLLSDTVNGQHRMFTNPDSLGYTCYWKIMQTLAFGLPQNRERVYIVGFREPVPNFRFPTGEPLTKRLKDMLEHDVDKKYYLSERALARILRKTENTFNPKIDPEVSGTINTKNNSGQLSMDQGTTLITNRKTGHQTEIYKSDVAPCLKGGGGHDDINIVVVGNITENSQAGMVYSTDGVSPTLLLAGAQGYAQGYIREDKEEIVVVNNEGTLEERDAVQAIDANYGKGMDNHCQRSFILQRERGKNEGGLFEECPAITSNSFQQNNHVVELPADEGYPEHWKPLEGETSEQYWERVDKMDAEFKALGWKPKTELYPVPVIEKKLQFVGGVEAEGVKLREEDGKKLSRNYKEGHRIYSADGISSTVKSSGGGLGGKSGLYKIDEDESLEPVILRQVGRNPENPKSRKAGLETEQMLEQKEDGVSGAITTVQKDNLVGYVERQQDRLNEEDGISKTLVAGTHSNAAHHIKTRLLNGTVRRLTPREVFRLQGFLDSFIINKVSESQAYKQAGNAMSRTVVQAIIKSTLKHIICQ